MARRVVLLLLCLLAAGGCRRGEGRIAGPLKPKQSLGYVVVGPISEKGDAFVRELLDKVADRTGIRLQWHPSLSWTPADSSGKATDLLAQAAVPDLVVDTEPHFQEWAAAGYYTALEELLPSQCPNILKYLTPDILGANRVDGKLYGIPWTRAARAATGSSGVTSGAAWESLRSPRTRS